MSNEELQARLDRIFNAHMNAELAGDLETTLATMAPDPHLVNVPTMVGGQGPQGVRRFYANRLIGQFFCNRLVHILRNAQHHRRKIERIRNHGQQKLLPLQPQIGIRTSREFQYLGFLL